MANQQATKNWFIGFMEGEGCFIERRILPHDNRDNRKINYQPCCTRVSNTEIDLIHICQRFLNQNGILHYVVSSKRGKNKQMNEIYISGEQECKILYHLVKDQMDCRINELERILGASSTTREMSLDLDWLIGFFEAEACFTISTGNHKAGNISHTPEIIMENTNPLTVMKSVKIFHNLGLSWYVRDCQREHKPYQRITISGCKRIDRFLKATNGLWLGSKTIRKTRLLKEYCDSRLSKKPKEPYSDDEHLIAREIKTKR